MRTGVSEHYITNTNAVVGYIVSTSNDGEEKIFI